MPKDIALMSRHSSMVGEQHMACADDKVLTISATNIFTIVTDLAMLALSIPLILKAKRQRSQNVGIIVAILTGALSVTASCARLHSIVIYDFSREPLRDAAPIYIWSFIEISAGMCCASMAGEFAYAPRITYWRLTIICSDRTALHGVQRQDLRHHLPYWTFKPDGQLC